jgi:4-amino-4-deoxy-L-arabinose transferase-like glycosyltransferase
MIARESRIEFGAGVPLRRWHAVVLAVSIVASLGLGFANIAKPSLWHDELLHAYVSKSIAETGESRLPSGVPYYNGTTYHLLLTPFIKAFGMTETALRSPSVVVSTANVALTFIVVRHLLGNGPAALTALLLALSPWTVAWSRQVNFYPLQQTLYLAFLLSALGVVARSGRTRWVCAGVAVAAYVLAVLTSYHSILFLGAAGLFAGIGWLTETDRRRFWSIVLVGLTLLGVGTLLAFSGLMNPLDRQAVFDRGGLGGQIVDPLRSTRGYYTLWLRQNLSVGFFLVAMAGTGALLVREGKRGWLTILAFWVPVLILTFLIGYRRPRFMYFAFPFYIAAIAYALWMVPLLFRRLRATTAGRFVAGLTAVFLLRLAWSFILLTGDSIGAASGADTTLARRHPQWKEPCAYVKERLTPDIAVVTTTYLPVLHYVGRVDNWYPSRVLWWEVDESGMDDLKELEDFQAFMRAHPKGYYIAEWWRFHRALEVPEGEELRRDVRWVMENLTRIDEACSQDVVVWAWGMDDAGS